jgi:hypothetical protein
VVEAYLPVETLCLLQNAVEDIIALQYIEQIEYGESMYRKDPLIYLKPLEYSLTYVNALKARDHKSMAPDCGYKVVTDNFNVFVHVEDIDQLVDRHGGSTPTEEEHNIFIREKKEPLIVERSHWSWNPKPLETPQTVQMLVILLVPMILLVVPIRNVK